MGATVGTLAINIVARHQSFTKGLGHVRRELSLGELAAKSFIKVFAGIGAALTLRNAASATREFNQSMRSSLAIMGDVSEAMQKDMANAARTVSFETKFAANQAAEAYFFLASAGLDAKQSIAALPQVAAFAQAGMFDLARATDLATDAQSALGLTVPDAEQNLQNLTRVTDVLVKANTLANASVEQFSEALTNKAGAAIRIVGKDIEEGVAVLAAFADQGVKGAEAGTALNIVFRDLQTKALQNAQAFRQMGITVFDAAGEMVGVASIIRDVEAALAGLSDQGKKAALLELGFTDKSIAFLQTLVGTSEKIREYEDALRSASGITREVAEKQLPPFEQGLNKLTAAFSLMADVLLGPVLSALGSAMTFLIDSLRGLHGETAKTMVKVAVFTATLLGALFVVPKIVSALKAIITSLRAMATAQAALNALTGNWITLIVGGIAAFGAAYAVDAAFADMQQSADDAIKQANQAATVDVSQFQALREEVMATTGTIDSGFNETLRRAKQITESLRNPYEIFADTLNKLKTLFNQNAIAAETFTRGVAKAKNELLAATQARESFESFGRTTVGAVVRGTTEEFSATRDSRRVAEEQKKIVQENLELNKRRNRILQDGFNEATRRANQININEINLD